MFVDLVGSTALSARLDPEEMREVLARLPGRGRGRGRPLRGPRRQVHGRRRARLLRLAQGARGRGRAGGPGRARRSPRRSAGCATPARRAARGAGRDRDRPRRGRRPRRRGRGPGGGRGRRDPEPGRAAAGAGRARATVVVAERTRRLLGGLFELEDLGRARAQGLRRAGAGLPRARARAGPRAASRRCTARASTPLVGREQELALLLDRWERAKEGEGQVVLLAGEPGIGKSRLVQRPARAARAASRTRRCATSARPTTPDSALHPVIEPARAGGRVRAATTRPSASSTSSRRCSRRRRPDVGEAAPLAGRLLVDPDRGPLPAARPHARSGRRSGRFEALLDQLAGLAARAAGAGGLRGRALGRPDHARAARPGRSSGSQRLPVLRGRHLPARVRAAAGPATRTSPR